MKPQRFWSEHYQRHCISLSATPAINPHIDLNQYRREIELMAKGDPDVLDALLLGKWGDLAGGSAFGSVWSPRRCRHELPDNFNIRDHLPRAFVVGDWGISAPSVFYLVLPNPPGLDTPRGSLHLADELYICERNRAGRQWGKGAMLSNGEQAEILRDWLGRWNLTPNDLRVFMDDAIFARNGSPNGSVSGDFRQSGVRMTPVGKSVVSLESGLGKFKSRLSSTRKDYTSAWLTWSRRCAGFEATIPSLARDPIKVERLASGQVDHAADAVRYAITKVDATWTCGQSNWRVW